MEDVYDYVRESDLTSDLKLIMQSCGIETVKSMLRGLSGLSFYIPKITRLEDLVFRYYKENSEKSLKQVARDLGVSDAYLKKVIRMKRGSGD